MYSLKIAGALATAFTTLMTLTTAQKYDPKQVDPNALIPVRECTDYYCPSDKGIAEVSTCNSMPWGKRTYDLQFVTVGWTNRDWLQNAYYEDNPQHSKTYNCTTKLCDVVADCIQFNGANGNYENFNIYYHQAAEQFECYTYPSAQNVWGHMLDRPSQGNFNTADTDNALTLWYWEDHQ